jgi:hypothetical protein
MSRLEFGIFDSFGPFEMAEFPTVAEVYEAHLQEAQEAEQLGYRYYFFIEHQNSPVCAVTSPNVYLTALASRPRIRREQYPRAAGAAARVSGMHQILRLLD